VFLLVPTGFHLADWNVEIPERWVARWLAIWLTAFRALLVVVAIGGPIYVFTKEGGPLLMKVEVIGASLVALVAFGVSFGKPARRLPALLAMLLVLVTAGLTVRSYHYTGDHSFAHLGHIAHELRKDGYHVQIDRLYPGFVFYADTVIPLETDTHVVMRRLAAHTPYYYFVGQEELKQLAARIDMKNVKRLTKPYTSKKLILIGNASLPPDIKP